MDDLIAFLRARMDEDDQAAKAAGWQEQAADLLRARARAIRGLIGEHGTPGEEWLPQVRILAASYAWHPDYRQEWRP